MKQRISMTNFLLDEDFEGLIALCPTRGESASRVRALAAAGYMIPIAVLQFCFQGKPRGS